MSVTEPDDEDLGTNQRGKSETNRDQDERRHPLTTSEENGDSINTVPMWARELNVMRPRTCHRFGVFYVGPLRIFGQTDFDQISSAALDRPRTGDISRMSLAWASLLGFFCVDPIRKGRHGSSRRRGNISDF
jgi:hypothetical protein